jgi:hypothetical protein
MIKVENTYVYNIFPAIRSMRNALKSWDRMDSIDEDVFCSPINIQYNWVSYNYAIIGSKDMELAKRLIFRGGDERKFLRTIHVNCDITTTRAHQQEIDTYKIGTVKNSCSTMHSILNQPLTQNDFQNLISPEYLKYLNNIIETVKSMKKEGSKNYRETFAELKHSLPEGYLLMFNFDTNYEQLLSMYHKRKNHFFLDWEPINRWCESLPYFMEFYSAILNSKN